MAFEAEDGRTPLAGVADETGSAGAPPHPHDPNAPDAGWAGVRTLVDDIEALIHDGRTYVDAELSYQKTRAAFISDRVKKTLAYAGVAAVLGLLAGIGLTVGLIIALTPLITAWGATAVVVGLLLIAAFVLLSRAAGNWKGARRAMRDETQPGTPPEDS
jgi:hypothetical protein